jgi:hypothetical protein
MGNASVECGADGTIILFRRCNSQTVTGTLTWNSNGSLMRLAVADQPNTNSRTCNYPYDHLSRLSGAHCGAVWNQTFSPGGVLG